MWDLGPGVEAPDNRLVALERLAGLALEQHLPDDAHDSGDQGGPDKDGDDAAHPSTLARTRRGAVGCS